MTTYLFLAAIGPVQELIATARRSRDLWFGSYLLSELSRAAAQGVAAAPFNGRLIFPSTCDGWRIVNRVLAEVTTDKEPLAIGDQVGTAVRDRLRELRNNAFARLPWRDHDADLKELAQRQVDDLYELYWVATPLDGTDYQRARNRVEDLMAARKATRDFRPSPVMPGQYLPKSSLDGSRESVIPARYYPKPGATAQERDELAQQIYSAFGAGAAERLSGIDLLKRHGRPRPEEAAPQDDGGAPVVSPEAAAPQDDGDFPSTSHMAMLGHGVSYRPEMAAARDRYFAVLRNLGVNRYQNQLASRFHNDLTGHYDGGLLFESRLMEEIADPQRLATARRALRTFLTTALHRSELPPYYALLIADGDNMGKAIDAQPCVDDHRAISAALSTFAAGVEAIVEGQYRGALIYAGGDDVMAYLPVDQVLACGQALAASFAGLLAPFTFLDDVTREQRSATLSAGIVIAHHLEPLSDVLALARAAEHQAKAVAGKAAFCLTVDKRSGTARSIEGRWTDRAFLSRFRQMIGWYRREALPRGYAYELRDLALQLGLIHNDGSHNEKADRTMVTVAHAEAVRILKRKQAEGGTRAIGREIVATISALLKLTEETVKDRPILRSDVSLAKLVDELIIAHELRWAQVALQEEGQGNANVAD